MRRLCGANLNTFKFHSRDSSANCNVYTFGRGEYGQLGHGDRCSLSSPTPIAVFSALDAPIVQISLGTSHSAGLTSSGKVYTWGYGGDGRLGHGTENDELEPRILDGPIAAKNLVQVVCGELHTAALTEDGKVYTWGLGKNGRLGHGDAQTYMRPLLVSTLVNSKTTIVQIACGGLHTSALTDSGRVITWGRGKDGRLGHGDESDHLLPSKLTTWPKRDVTLDKYFAEVTTALRSLQQAKCSHGASTTMVG